jgi:hypothetical protein
MCGHRFTLWLSLAICRPASPQAVLASTQPTIAWYHDARCGDDAAGRLRCVLVVPSGPEPIQQPGARCAQEHVASPPRPPGNLPGPMPDFCAAGRGGAGLPCLHPMYLLCSLGAQHAARRSAKLYDISDRRTVATPYHLLFILLGWGGMANPACGGNKQIRMAACGWGCEYFPSQQGCLGCPARPAPRAMGSPTYAQLKSRRGAPGSQPGSRDQLGYSKVSEFAPERICPLSS